MSDLCLVHQDRADRLVVRLLRFRDRGGVKLHFDGVFDDILNDAGQLAEGIRKDNERENQRTVPAELVGCGLCDRRRDTEWHKHLDEILESRGASTG